MLVHNPQSIVSLTLSCNVCLGTHEIPHSYSFVCSYFDSAYVNNSLPGRPPKRIRNRCEQVTELSYWAASRHKRFCTGRSPFGREGHTELNMTNQFSKFCGSKLQLSLGSHPFTLLLSRFPHIFSSPWRVLKLFHGLKSAVDLLSANKKNVFSKQRLIFVFWSLGGLFFGNGFWLLPGVF